MDAHLFFSDHHIVKLIFVIILAVHMTILLGFSAVVNRSPVLDYDTEIVADNASYNTAGSWSEGVMMEAKCDWITDMTLSIWTNHLNINFLRLIINCAAKNKCDSLLSFSCLI